MLAASVRLLGVALLLLVLQFNSFAGTYIYGSYNHFVGPTGGSLVDQPGYSLGIDKTFGSGFARLNFGMEGITSSGTMRFNSNTLAYDMMGGTANLGVSFHPFYKDFLGPFVGGGALGGIDVIRTSSPPLGEKLSSEAFHKGFEVYGGLDLGTARGFHLRFKSAYRRLRREYGGKDNFYMDSLTFTFGLGYGESSND